MTIQLDIFKSNDFSVHPITKTVSSGVVNSTYSVFSYGDEIIGSTGIWNTNILASTGTTAITSQEPFIAPLSAINYPTDKFCGILDFTLDNVKYPLVFTNSPKIFAEYPSDTNITTNNLFWLNNLRIIQLNDVFAAVPDEFYGDYHYGTDPHIMNLDDPGTAVKINFTNPVTTDIDFLITFDVYDLQDNLLSTYTVQTPFLATNNLNNNVLCGLPFVAFFEPGYIQITVTPADSTLLSIIPFYFWGISVVGSLCGGY